jgi:hypothetical protein
VTHELFLGKGDHQNTIGGCYSHAHNGSHESRDTESRPRYKQKRDDAGERRWQGRDDDKGSSQG